VTHEKAAWRMVFESYPCPTCGVPARTSCRTVSGRIADVPHAERTRMADRCPICGSIVANEANPAGLCPRCTLVRSLEVERSTTHVRLDPDP